MDQKFYRSWFEGFACGLDQLDADNRTRLLRKCAQNCADSGVLKAYQAHWQKVNGDRDAFYQRISELGGVEGAVIIPGKKYAVIYPECLCDLHTSGGVNTCNLCECSRQSLIYVTAKTWGTENIEVRCLGTILGGQDKCSFEISFCDPA